MNFLLILVEHEKGFILFFASDYLLEIFHCFQELFGLDTLHKYSWVKVSLLNNMQNNLQCKGPVTHSGVDKLRVGRSH